MEAIKYSHPIFESAHGLVLIIDGEVALLYPQRYEAIEAQFEIGQYISNVAANFTLFHTGEQFKDYEQLQALLDRLNECDGTQGTSQTATLPVILGDMNDELLAAIYLEVVGYNPFEETTAEEARALVVDYLQQPEALSEIFYI